MKDTLGVTHDSTWGEAPEWAKWKTQDGDGTWQWFSHKPHWGNWGLYRNGTWMLKSEHGENGKQEYIKTKGTHYITGPNPDSKNAIWKRPKHAKPQLEENL
jgi:hypothetical protein